MRSQVLGKYSALQVYSSEKITWLRQCIDSDQRNRIMESNCFIHMSNLSLPSCRFKPLLLILSLHGLKMIRSFSQSSL